MWWSRDYGDAAEREAIKLLEPPSRVRDGVSGALLEYAVMHGDEAERIRDERTGGCVGFAEGRRPRGDRPTGAGSAGGWSVGSELHEMHC